MTVQNNLDLVWARDAGAGVVDTGDTKYVNGWVVEIPTYQNFNFVLQNNSKNILVLAEQGSHDWQTEITYQPGARVNRLGRFYTCRATSTGIVTTGADPASDATKSYWISGMLLGEDLQSNALPVRGMHIKDVNPRADSVTWDGNDVTIESKLPIIALNVDGAAKNWGLANVTGELCAVDLDIATLPDDASIALAAARTSRLYHEGHKPTQSEVVGTIPDAPSDGNNYSRRDSSWIKSEETTWNTSSESAFVHTGAVENTYHDVDLTGYCTGAKFAIVRLVVSGFFDHSLVKLIPFGANHADWVGEPVVQQLPTGQIVVPLDSLDRFQLYWLDSTISVVTVYVEGWIE